MFSKAKARGEANRYRLARRELRDDEVTPFLVNTLIIYYIFKKAQEFLEQRKAKGFTPDSSFQEKEGPLIETMQVIHMCADFLHSNTLDKDVQEFVQKSFASAWNIIELVFKMYIALLDDGNVNDAMELCNTFRQTRTEPLVIIHTLVIEAYLKFGKTKGALEAYKAMLAAGVAPNSYTYTVLIRGLAADPNFFGDAKKYLLEMMDKGKRPNAAPYTAVIEGFARQEDREAEDEGKEFVEVLMGKGFVPNAKAMREVLKGRSTPYIRKVMNIVLSKLKG